MMHCPSCGNESSLEQKFCRKCGFNLEPVSQLVVARPDAETKLEKQESDRAILRRMYRWMMWGFLILLIGVVMLVSGKAFDLPKFLGPLSSFLLIGGATAAGYGVLAALRDGLVASKKLPHAAETRRELSGSQTSELPDNNIPASLPSVTERTTQLIGDKADRNR
jgi:hypothetical protein